MVIEHRWLCLLLCSLASSAGACNIPVFRYALERWQQDAYEIVIHHGAELSTSDREFLDQLQSLSQLSGGPSNITLVHKSDDAITVPSLRVTTVVGGRTIEFWRGTIDEAKQLGLTASPVRTELIRRLLAGDSVVWLLLRSSDARQSDEVRDLLTDSFASLKTKIRLPDGVGLPGSELHSEVPLLVKFSLIEVDPADDAESFLVQSLRRFRPDAIEQNEPLLIPVFGRGRALEVIPANELTAPLIEDLSMFLSAACSCQVKEQNPGFDLLLSVDWDTRLYGASGVRPPPPVTVDGSNRPPVLLSIPPGKRK